MMKRKVLAILLCVLILSAFTSTAFAYDQYIRGVKVYGGTPSRVIAAKQPREKSNFSMTIYSDSAFNTEANMTFRCYKVDDDSARRSNSISFYLNDWYNGQNKTVSFLNGGGSATQLDLRGSIPNSNSTAYAWFYGYAAF